MKYKQNNYSNINILDWLKHLVVIDIKKMQNVNQTLNYYAFIIMQFNLIFKLTFFNKVL